MYAGVTEIDSIKRSKLMKMSKLDVEHETEEDCINIETSLNLNNPKLQLLIENTSTKISKKKDKLFRGHSEGKNLEELLDEEMIYFYERKLRKLYDDPELHSLILSLVISLLITPNSGVLESAYCSQLPVCKQIHDDS
jgi:hypothetical protein